MNHMRRSIPYFVIVLLSLSAAFSCRKPDPENNEEQEQKQETPLPPTTTTAIAFADTLSLIQLLPELETSPVIRYDLEMGYYIPLGERTWNQSFSIDPVYIPSQSHSFPVKAVPYETYVRSGWLAEVLQYVILKDVRLPEPDCELYRGLCQSVVRLNISLGENAPYRKVTLSDIQVRFPGWLRASPSEGSIPNLTVTEEGATLSFDVTTIDGPFEFVDKEGRRCYSAETTFHAFITASPEDAVDGIAEAPSEIALACTFEFDRIDFTTCELEFRTVSFPKDTVRWDAVPLPSFLSGEEADICLPESRILIDFKNGFPLNSSHLEADAFFGDRKTPFSLGNSTKYMLMRRLDAIYRPDTRNMDVEKLGDLFHGPFAGGLLQPAFSFQPVSEQAGWIDPGREYEMSVKADWALPLAFTGRLDAEGVPTKSISLDGDALDAPANSSHEIRQEVSSSLPFDCLVTPVFTMEGEDPVILDGFILKRYDYGRDHAIVFTPSKDHWKATLHYIVTPTEGGNEFLRKDGCLIVRETRFTANLNEE